MKQHVEQSIQTWAVHEDRLLSTKNPSAHCRGFSHGGDMVVVLVTMWQYVEHSRVTRGQLPRAVHWPIWCLNHTRVHAHTCTHACTCARTHKHTHMHAPKDLSAADKEWFVNWLIFYLYKHFQSKSIITEMISCLFKSLADRKLVTDSWGNSHWFFYSCEHQILILSSFFIVFS